MTNDTENERKDRAARLHREIDELTGKESGTSLDNKRDTSSAPKHDLRPPANPRDFIQRRMRELAEDDDGGR